MIDLTLTEKFSMIGLKNQRSSQMTKAKKASLRCIAAAVVIEAYVEAENPSSIFDEKREKHLSCITTIIHLFKPKDRLIDLLTQVTKFSNNQLQQIETVVSKHLINKHLIRVKNSLLSCDLEFETAGIIVQEYVVNESIYQGYVEEFRAELLEGFELDKDSMALLWLCKESGSLSEVFSENELLEITNVYDEWYEKDDFANELYEVVIHRTSENIAQKFLKWKKEEIATAFGSGLNFIFPMIERSQAVFIASESYFSGNDQLLKVIKAKLDEFDIYYTVKKVDDVHLLKIDGIYYEAIPFAKKYHMPVHGVQLRKYPVALQA